MERKTYKNQIDEVSFVSEPVAMYQTTGKLYPKTITALNRQDIQNDWWNTISEIERRSIEEGIKDLKAGRIISHTEITKRYEKWIGNQMDTECSK
ncbi:hypothetical protein FACS1894145_4290 [Bacteroidia bacterium]|nr:hypothetical protein FACS1894145_4290 [Bacteroidia bacterium]